MTRPYDRGGAEKVCHTTKRPCIDADFQQDLG